jgi:PTH1 family peptidyl-tRNA hydrolase
VDGGHLVVGLGNPEPRYAGTRHNIGFAVVDELLARCGGRSFQDKFQGRASRVDLGGAPVLLLKPMTYMNLSGKSVSRAGRYHRIAPEQIIIVHDDLDLPFATTRVKRGGGTGGHKGLVSCIADVGSRDFLRVRMGIGRPPYGDATDYVLSAFTRDEETVLRDFIARGASAVATIIERGTSRAMNEFNQREGGTDES